MPKIPRYLYHGTSTDHLDSICEKGLLRGTVETCNRYSREEGFLQDCVGSVSLAKKEKDAIFFAVVANMEKMEGAGVLPSQAIFKISTDALDKDLFLARDMFGTKDTEVKYLDDVPPKAIESVRVRSFSRVDGKLETKDEVQKC